MNHDGSHIGTTCPDCGTHHRILDSLPAHPLTPSILESLRDSESVSFCRGIEWIDSRAVGVDAGEDVTENIVLATEGSALLLSLYDPGWVVEFEEEPEDGEDIQQVAETMWTSHSQMLGEALRERI
jgi:hypothetical protein